MTWKAIKESKEVAANAKAEILISSDEGHGFEPGAAMLINLVLTTKDVGYTAGNMTVTGVHVGRTEEEPVLDENGDPLVINLALANEPKTRPINNGCWRKLFVQGASMTGSTDPWRASAVLGDR